MSKKQTRFAPWLTLTLLLLYCTFKGTGPVTYKSETEGRQFENAINALQAHGGGDCPELTFRGILDGFAESPQYGSPLYVFTDATAKDATTITLLKYWSLRLDVRPLFPSAI